MNQTISEKKTKITAAMQTTPILAIGVKQAFGSSNVSVVNMMCAFCKISFMRAGDRLNLFDNKGVEQIFCSHDCKDRYRVAFAGETCGYCNEKIDKDNCYTSPFEKGVLRFCNEAHTRKYLLSSTPDALVEEKYVSNDSENNDVSRKSIRKCTICAIEKPILYCIVFDGREYDICGKPCFDGFCKRERLKLKICDHCTDMIEPDVNDKISMVFEGKKYGFCKMGCMKKFQVAKKKTVNCAWCSKSKHNLDMIEHAVINKDQKLISHFCCLTCLTKYRALRPHVKLMECSVCSKQCKPEYYIGYINGQMENCCSLACVKGRAAQSLASGRESVFVTKDGIYLHPREIRVMTCSIDTENLTTSTMSTVTNKRRLSEKIDELRKRNVQESLAGIAKRPKKSTPHKYTGNNDTDGSDYLNDTDTELVDNLPTLNGTTPSNQSTSVSGLPADVHPVKMQVKVEIKKEFVPLPIPIPVPVYIPVPMMMYQQPVPEPIPIPVPIPCPIFFPTTIDKADELIAYIEELKTSLPSDPLEAEIFAKAAREADKYENETPKLDVIAAVSEQANNLMDTNTLIAATELLDSEIFEGTNMEEFNVEQDFDPLNWKTTTPPPKPPKNRKGKRTGGKRASHLRANNTFGLNSKYGLSAWFTHQNSIKNGIYIDFAKIPASQLSVGLCDFVENATNSKEELLRVDSLVYLLLGLQQCLNHNAREHDQIFLSPYYYQFQQKLAVKIDNWQPNIYPHFHVVDTRVWEEHLWQSEQLGAHSPYTLLFTTVYFITKCLSLTSHEDLFDITFDKIKTAFDSDDDSFKITGFNNELTANTANPLQCPVKLIKFYMKKCPKHELESPMSIFLSPLKAVKPSKDTWYGSIRVSKRDLENMHSRVLMVKEVIQLWYDTGVYNSSNTETVTL